MIALKENYIIFLGRKIYVVKIKTTNGMKDIGKYSSKVISQEVLPSIYDNLSISEGGTLVAQGIDYNNNNIYYARTINNDSEGKTSYSSYVLVFDARTGVYKYSLHFPGSYFSGHLEGISVIGNTIYFGLNGRTNKDNGAPENNTGKVCFLKYEGLDKIEEKYKKDFESRINKFHKDNNWDTAIFFGDSITYGSNSSAPEKHYSWSDYVEKNYNIVATNAGKGGWQIGETDNGHTIYLHMENFKNNDYTYVILHGGCNDIGKSRSLGTFDANDFSGNYDASTFCGGLETYIYKAINNWPNAKIGYIVNYRQPNNAGRKDDKSRKYYDQMKAILQKWNIDYLDLFDGKTSDGKSYSTDLLKVDDANTSLMRDTVHLSKDGYEVISPYIYEWMKTLSLNYQVGTKQYKTFAEAQKAIKTSGTIKLLKNVTESSGITIAKDKSIVLDTNGKTLIIKESQITNNGKLDIKGKGRIESSLRYLIINNGELSVENTTLVTNGNNQDGNWYTIFSKAGTVTVKNGCNIGAKGTAGASKYIGYAIAIKGGSSLTIEGGEVKSYVGYAISSVASNTGEAGKEIIIKGGSIGGSNVENSNAGVRLYAQAGYKTTTTLQMTGGEIKAKNVGIDIQENTECNVNVQVGTVSSKIDVAIKDIGNGKLIIGKNDKTVSIKTPIIQGKTIGIKSQNGFEFYDGFLKGETNAYEGKVNGIPSNYDLEESTEKNLKTVILKAKSTPKTTPATTIVKTTPKPTAVKTTPAVTVVKTTPKPTATKTTPKPTATKTTPKPTTTKTTPVVTVVKTTPTTAPKTTPATTTVKTTPTTAPKTTPATTIIKTTPKTTTATPTTPKPIQTHSWSQIDYWAVEEVTRAEEKELIPNILENKDFRVPITRQEFAHIAVRLYEEISGYDVRIQMVITSPFTDIDDTEVTWAYILGITNGTSDTTFTPEAEITREQMATMLTRALSKAGIDTEVNLEDVEKFVDDGDMHDWGRDSIYFMSNLGIIKGVGDNTFNVLGNAKIEEAVLISLRSVEHYEL